MVEALALYSRFASFADAEGNRILISGYFFILLSGPYCSKKPYFSYICTRLVRTYKENDDMGFRIDLAAKKIFVNYNDMPVEHTVKDKLKVMDECESFSSFIRDIIIKQNFLSNVNPTSSLLNCIFTYFQPPLTEPHKAFLTPKIQEKCAIVVNGIKNDIKNAFLANLARSNKAGSITGGTTSKNTGVIYKTLLKNYVISPETIDVQLGHEGGGTDHKEIVFKSRQHLVYFCFRKACRGWEQLI